MSILPRPLTWQDIFDIEAEKKRRDLQIESDRLVLDDIRFFLFRLSLVITGDSGSNFMPSRIAQMEKNLEAQADNK